MAELNFISSLAHVREVNDATFLEKYTFSSIFAHEAQTAEFKDFLVLLVVRWFLSTSH